MPFIEEPHFRVVVVFTGTDFDQGSTEVHMYSADGTQKVDVQSDSFSVDSDEILVRDNCFLAFIGVLIHWVKRMWQQDRAAHGIDSCTRPRCLIRFTFRLNQIWMMRYTLSTFY
jgi:hypothetical protein